MASEMKEDANEEIADFRKALQTALGDQHVPDGSPGDLSDLLGTLREGITLLQSLSELPRDGDLSTLLHRIEVLLEDDIPMICADLIPAIKIMRECAYEVEEER